MDAQDMIICKPPMIGGDGSASSSSFPTSAPRHRRSGGRRRWRRKSRTIQASHIFSCMVHICVIHIHQWSSTSTLFFYARQNDDGRHRSSVAVQAFTSSDGRSCGRFSGYPQSVKTPARINNGAGIYKGKTVPSTALSMNCPSKRSCTHFSMMDVPPVCRSDANAVWSGGDALKRLVGRAGVRYREGRSSLLVCQSTISDETSTVDAVETTTASSDPSNGHSQIISGANGLNGVNGDHISIGMIGDVKLNGAHQSVESIASPSSISVAASEIKAASPDPDVATLTANGGYTHTASSKAKISAANKGNVPWNKGKARSPEVRARIAEGVRKRNREKFLSKLAKEGITEEEYNERKKEERRKKDAERRARRTAKGGYTPTAETKAKISNILKEKYASGELKRAPRDPSTIRRGFKHSEETKQKIRDSLRKKWKEDPEYRERMMAKTIASGKVDASVRQRISETLKRKWEDPEFRDTMMAKFANRKLSHGTRDKSHRKKISEAMKKKWMDEEYRRRATEGMNKGRERSANKVKVKLAKPVEPKLVKKQVAAVQPLSPLKAGQKAPTKTKKVKRKKKVSTKRKSKSVSDAVKAATPLDSPATKREEKKLPDEIVDDTDGSILRMREERRDLYDLLYGDEDDSEGQQTGMNVNGKRDPAGVGVGRPVTGESSVIPNGASSDRLAALLGDDEDLDDFDPYGLHDTAPPPVSGR